MGIIAKLKQIFFRKKEKIDEQNKILNEWKTIYEKLQKHPLTQAKIINEELLKTVDEIKIEQNKMSQRVDILENQILNKNIAQKEITEKIKEIKEPIEKIKEKIIVPYTKLSKQEKKIIEFIKDNIQCNANELSSVLKMSRSNASLKLNKLYSWNFLNKQLDGKNMTYILKTKDKIKTSKR